MMIQLRIPHERLTRAGRAQFRSEVSAWERYSRLVTKALTASETTPA